MIAFLVFSVVVHLPPVQRRMGCPFGHGATTNPDVVPVVSVPLLGFRLGTTRRPDVSAWAIAHGVQCTQRRTTLECVDVPGAALGIADVAMATVWFELSGDTVRAVRTSRSSRDAETSVHTLAAISARLARDVGLPVATAGTLEPAAITGGLAQISREYRRENVRAVIRATHIGDRFVVTESYAAWVAL